MGRVFVQNPVRLSGTSFLNCYEIIKNLNSSVKANQYKDDSISKWYASHELKISRTYTGPVNTEFSIAKSGFCNKFEEIPIDTIIGEKVFLPDNELKVNDFSFAAGRTFGYLEQVFGTIDPFSPSSPPPSQTAIMESTELRGNLFFKTQAIF